MNTSSPDTPASAPKSLAEWLAYLESIHPTTIDMGLDRVSVVAERLGFDFSASKVITVAGTNGKGTTCRFLEQALVEQGKRVAVYSSPHLQDYRERVRLNGELQPEPQYCDAFAKVEAARQDVSLTYFEFGTLAAMQMMQAWEVEFVILEVGLGGRLDATNIVAPTVAVITTIDLDHQDWLGDTREKIALEKAGIFREGCQAVIGELDPPDTLAQEVKRLNVNALWANQDFSYRDDVVGWSWNCGQHHFDTLPIPHIPKQNISTALATLSVLGLMPQSIALRELTSQINLMGRQQQICSEPNVVVDVAHNPQATREMVKWLHNYDFVNLYIVVGMLKDKSIEATLLPMAGIEAEWFLGTTKGPRGCPASLLYDALPYASQEHAQTFDSIADAYRAACAKCKQNDMVLVFGSFLTVADVLALSTH